jgi:RNA binding exosome subunit
VKTIDDLAQNFYEDFKLMIRNFQEWENLRAEDSDEDRVEGSLYLKIRRQAATRGNRRNLLLMTTF